MHIKRFIALSASIISILSASASTHNPLISNTDSTRSTQWVDSVFANLTLRERVAQLFMVAGYTNKDKAHTDELTNFVTKEGVGGIIFFQGGPVRQVNLTNKLQQSAKVPLLISMDAEWGPGMRLDSTFSYPRQMMLGAINDNSLIYQMGADIARQLKRLGVHVNFAPVIDINSNPQNPVINTRAFGENREQTVEKGLAYMAGMQDNGVLACAKHFPGHGDTDADSHYTLPLVNHSKQRLDSIELYPFKKLIDKGVSGVMVSHLNIPALEKTQDLAASLSYGIVQKLLVDTMGFNGLIYTDALNMKGVSEHYKPIKLNLMALEAGNDVLVFPEKVKESIDAIVAAVEKGDFPESEINRRCKKVLYAKYMVGLNRFAPIDTTNLVSDLNQPSSLLLKRTITEKALTIINNNNALPIKRLDTLNIAYLEVGYDKGNPFREQMELYAPINTYSINPDAPIEEFDSLLVSLKSYNLIIVGLHSLDNRYSKNFGISPELATFLFDLSYQKRMIVSLFGTPYALSKLFNTRAIEGIIVSYDNSPLTQELTAQLIFGGTTNAGSLPVTAATPYSAGVGNQITKQTRLKYTIPEELGISSSKFNVIDSIANEAIAKLATPGMQILVAKDGKVIYNKAFGGYTYTSTIPVDTRTLYDIASVTKIAATLPVIIKFTDQKRLTLDHPLAAHIKFKEPNNKSNLKIRDILLHQAGLQAWIPFYIKTMTTLIPGDSLMSKSLSVKYSIAISDKQFLHKHSVPSPKYYSNSYSFDFPSVIAKDLYVVEGIRDTVFSWMNASPLNQPGKYKYSDLSFLYLQRVAENGGSKGLDELSSELFYKQLGMNYTCFNPLQKFELERIAPTENDIVFRKQLVHGYVHDPAAAMLGGVAGHAGLFSNANDLAKLMQLYLNAGTYGNEQYFSAETMKTFSTCANCTNGNRRGLGFDKPETREEKPSPVSRYASPSSFGHSGFTGTLVWVDPEYNLVYIFLSNRVYPDAANNKLVEMNIRTRIQDEIYKIIIGEE